MKCNKDLLPQGLYLVLLYSWKFFPTSACSHCLLRQHMTSNNETISRQNLWAGNIAKSMMLEGNSAMLPANVDQWLPLQQGLMNFQLQNFQLYNKSLVPWETVNFVSLESRLPLRKHWDSRETKLTVSWGTSHEVVIVSSTESQNELSYPDWKTSE